MPKTKRTKRLSDEFDLTLNGSKPLAGRNESQNKYLRHLKGRSDMVFGVGPAGTGKTYLAAAYGIEQVVLKRYEQIIITRATVPIEGEEIGFLPGTLEKKMEPWTAEIFSVFKERLGKEQVARMVREERIQIVPFAFMRGRTFKNAIVLVDEFQNTTPSQAKALVTRIGENTRYFINGDPRQSDIKGENGLDDLIGLVSRFNLPFPMTHFTSRDVERSAACRLWVEAYESKDTCSDVSFSQLQPPLC